MQRTVLQRFLTALWATLTGANFAAEHGMGTLLARPGARWQACKRLAGRISPAACIRVAQARAQPRAQRTAAQLPMAARTQINLRAAAPPSGGIAEWRNMFDVLALRSERTREVFRDVVSTFQCPWEDRWFLKSAWYVIKVAIDRQIDYRVANWEFDSKAPAEEQVTFRYGRRTLLPLIAVNDGKPCAAALYSDARTNDENTFFLRWLLDNAGDTCKGGATAILCQLIRDSRNKRLEFSPLRIRYPLDERHNLTYFESFGCTKSSASLQCGTQYPERCEHVVDNFVEADADLDRNVLRYRRGPDTVAVSSFLARISSGRSAGMTGVAHQLLFLAGSGSAIAALLRRRALSSGKRQLLTL